MPRASIKIECFFLLTCLLLSAIVGGCSCGEKELDSIEVEVVKLTQRDNIASIEIQVIPKNVDGKPVKAEGDLNIKLFQQHLEGNEVLSGELINEISIYIAEDDYSPQSRVCIEIIINENLPFSGAVSPGNPYFYKAYGILEVILTTPDGEVFKVKAYDIKLYLMEVD